MKMDGQMAVLNAVVKAGAEYGAVLTDTKPGEEDTRDAIIGLADAIAFLYCSDATDVASDEQLEGFIRLVGDQIREARNIFIEQAVGDDND